MRKHFVMISPCFDSRGNLKKTWTLLRQTHTEQYRAFAPTEEKK